ncbi:short-chain dehydrogenase/reductase family protein [Aspergillus carlsbadensis]|nr:short-chain dehydrogenase/reductase family protein [Aspergillus carlsbadensis]
MSQNLQNLAKKEGGMLAFFRRQFRIHPTPLPAGTDLAGRTVIITGGSGGLGVEASRQFLRLHPAHLIVTVRSQSKGDALTAKLRKEFPHSTISAWLLDMESYESIQGFVEQCKTLSRIDIVVLNAGLQKDTFERVEATGHEGTVQVNYISTALLAILLLPVLRSASDSSTPGSKPPLLSIVSSDTAYWAKFDLNKPFIPQFDNPKTFSPTHYQKSKLLLFWFIVKLSELVPADNVTVNLTNPGLTAGTDLNKDMFSKLNPVLNAVLSRLKGAVARTIEDGASNYIYATVVKGKESHGSYVSDWKFQPYPAVVYGAKGNKAKEQLWEETIKELEFADVASIVQQVAR